MDSFIIQILNTKHLPVQLSQQKIKLKLKIQPKFVQILQKYL